MNYVARYLRALNKFGKSTGNSAAHTMIDYLKYPPPPVTDSDMSHEAVVKAATVELDAFITNAHAIKAALAES